MTTPLFDMEGTGAEIAERLSSYAERRLHVIVLPVAEPDAQNKDKRPIIEMLKEIASNVSQRETDPLPVDFTDQLDHYIYGSPKR